MAHQKPCFPERTNTWLFVCENLDGFSWLASGSSFGWHVWLFLVHVAKPNELGWWYDPGHTALGDK